MSARASAFLRSALLAAAISAGGAASAQTDGDPGAPRSAIPWLTEAIEGGEAPADADAGPAYEGDGASGGDGAFGGDAPEIRALGQDGSDADDGAPTGSAGALGAVPVEAVSPDALDGVAGLAGVDAGLPPDPWSGSSPALALERIAALRPSDVASANRLAIEILSARQDPPPGADADAFLAARIAALTRFGALDRAVSLAAAVGRPELARDAALLAGATRGLCRRLSESRGDDPAQVFCLVQSGDLAAARRVLADRRARGVDPAPTLAALERMAVPAAARRDEEPPIGAAPIVVAAYLATGWRPGSEFARRASLASAPAALRAGVPPRARLEALERLERSGAVETSALRAAFEAQRSAESGGVWGRVAAYRAAVGAPDARFEAAVDAALSRAAFEGREAAMARLLAPTIRLRLVRGRIAASETTALRRALRLAGDGAAASALLAGPDGEAAFDGVDDVERAWDRLGAPRWSALWGPARSEALARRAGRGDQDAGRLLAALAAFGVRTADAPRRADDPDLPLTLADGRSAERAVDALALLARGSQSTPDALFNALTRLISAGLDEPARRIALEAAATRR